eukprot:TRINITY_DN3389_c0_g1_i2.p1 TRINITY_DN3389_c0_g1~~TRINITY_DN3389_c0_g1_i2.p1  ORF type:complete len:1225 (+),score=205.68 TRINITY_DN3389_c0_g1_i2:52-3726(+)
MCIRDRCLAVKDADQLIRGEQLPFMLHIQTAQHVQVPGVSLFATRSEQVSMSQQLSLTWFHAPSRRFLGRTYLSEPTPVGFVLTDDYATKNLQFDELVHFKTTLCDPDVLLVLELVLQIECVEQGVVKKHHECTVGWSVLNIFKDYDSVSADPRAYAEVLDAPLLGGSSRMLLCSLPPANIKAKSRLTFRFGVNSSMSPMLHLIASDTIYGQTASIPGLYRLRNNRISSSAYSVPSFSQPCLVPCSDLKIVNPTIEGLGPDTERRLLRDLSHNQADFLNNSVSGLEVVDRRLRIGAHNTHCWVTEPFSISLHRLEDNSLGFDGTVSLHGCPQDPYCGLVFEVWFTVSSTSTAQGRPHVSRRILVAYGVQIVCDQTGFLFSDSSVHLLRGPRRAIDCAPVYGGAALRTDPELYFELQPADYTGPAAAPASPTVRSHYPSSPEPTAHPEALGVQREMELVTHPPSTLENTAEPVTPMLNSLRYTHAPQHAQHNRQPEAPMIDTMVGGNLCRADRARLFSEMQQPLRSLRRGPTLAPVIISEPSIPQSGEAVRFNVCIRCVALSFSSGDMRPKHVELLYSFYSFAQVRSPKLSVLPPENEEETFQILVPSVQQNTDIGKGWSHSFNVDCSQTSSARKHFIQHLSDKHLEVEVWDVASQMQLGCARVILHDLCRGENAQIMYESEIIDVAGKPCGSLQAVILKSAQKPSDFSHKPPNPAVQLNLETRHLKPLVPEPALARTNSVQDDQAARKASRLEVMRQRQLMHTFAHSTPDDLHTRVLTQVSAATATRQAIKAKLVSQVIGKSDVVNHSVLVAPGQCSFFECRITNPYLEDSVFTVLYDDPDLRAISDASEWCALKQAHSIATPLEARQLWQADHGAGVQLYLQAKETVYVPFAVQHLEESEATNGQGSRTCNVEFQCQSSGKSIAQVCVNVQHMNAIVDRRWNFYAAEKEQFVADIPIPSDVMAVRCAHAGVRAEIEPPQCEGDPSLLVIRYRCAAAAEPPAQAKCASFNVYLYSDPYASMLSATWKISITVLHRVQVSGRVGEMSQVKLKLPPSNTARELRAFSSSPALLMALADGQLVTSPGEDCFVEMELVCRSPGGSDVIVNVVDLFSHECYVQYLVSTVCNIPTIKDTYELDIASHTGARRKVKYTNPYDTPRIFHIGTDCPDLLQLVRQSFQFGPRETHLLGLMFTPTNIFGPANIYIFVNDDAGNNEDCLLLKITYF